MLNIFHVWFAICILILIFKYFVHFVLQSFLLTFALKKKTFWIQAFFFFWPYVGICKCVLPVNFAFSLSLTVFFLELTILMSLNYICTLYKCSCYCIYKICKLEGAFSSIFSFRSFIIWVLTLFYNHPWVYFYIQFKVGVEIHLNMFAYECKQLQQHLVKSPSFLLVNEFASW